MHQSPTILLSVFQAVVDPFWEVDLVAVLCIIIDGLPPSNHLKQHHSKAINIRLVGYIAKVPREYFRCNVPQGSSSCSHGNSTLILGA
uniref:Uncharacterized protein n=1 Tax=Salix viminalis TaxID=40686 RepID=A0A6N2LM80_SALVM